MASARAVFLDRDHTVIHDPGYLSNPEAVKLLPGVERAIRSLAQAGYKIVVVTNQSGVARGLISVETLDAIHTEMRRQLAAGGAHVDGVYYCPYHPDGTVQEYAAESELRKPRPGMLLRAAKDLDIDLAASWMVGDSPRDIEAGQRAGCRTVRIRSGHTRPPGEAMNDDVQADFTVRTLPEAAKVILHPNLSRDSVRSGLATFVATGGTHVESEADDAAKVRQEILDCVKGLAEGAPSGGCKIARSIGTVAQGLAVLALIGAILALAWGEKLFAVVHAVVALTLQVMVLTFFTIDRRK